MTTERKKRVRLRKPNPKALAAMDKARDKSFKEAPRSKRGRIVPGYNYKKLLEGYKENGREPEVILPNSAYSVPMFVRQPNLAKRIVRLIRKGYPYTVVCRYCGVTPKTFIEWLEKGKAGYSREYVKFYNKVAKAEAQAEMGILKTLRGHAKADWRVSAWQLERRWPEHWSKQDRITAETKVNATITYDTKENLGKQIAHDASARELARKLIDSNDFNYAALPAPVAEEEETT